MILQRISSLKYLKLLNLSHYLTAEPTASLDFRLRHGLEQLSSLQELERILVRNLGLNLEEAEIDWMVRNWPRLRDLEGTFHQIPLMDKKLSEHYEKSRRQAHPNFTKQFMFQEV